QGDEGDDVADEEVDQVGAQKREDGLNRLQHDSQALAKCMMSLVNSSGWSSGRKWPPLATVSAPAPGISARSRAFSRSGAQSCSPETRSTGTLMLGYSLRASGHRCSCASRLKKPL